MVIGKTIDGAYFYAKDGLLGKWQKWILLIISCIIFPLFMGYMMRIYRGLKPAPELDEWGNMFIDGIKLWIVEIIFALPIIFLDFVLLGTASVAFISTLKASEPKTQDIFFKIVAQSLSFKLFFKSHFTSENSRFQRSVLHRMTWIDYLSLSFSNTIRSSVCEAGRSSKP